MDGGDADIWAIPATFLNHQEGAELEVEQLDKNQHSYGMLASQKVVLSITPQRRSQDHTF